MRSGSTASSVQTRTQQRGEAAQLGRIKGGRRGFLWMQSMHAFTPTAPTAASHAMTVAHRLFAWSWRIINISSATQRCVDWSLSKFHPPIMPTDSGQDGGVDGGGGEDSRTLDPQPPTTTFPSPSSFLRGALTGWCDCQSLIDWGAQVLEESKSNKADGSDHICPLGSFLSLRWAAANSKSTCKTRSST